MLHFITKRLRTPIMSSLLLILFAAFSLLLSLSAAYRIHVEENIQDTVNQFTAIAVANDNLLIAESFPLNQYGTHYLILEDLKGLVNFSQAYLKLRHFVNTSPYATLDSREYLRGVAKNAWPVLTRYMLPDAHFTNDEPYDDSISLLCMLRREIRRFSTTEKPIQ